MKSISCFAVVIVTWAVTANSLLAGALIERQGSYEINWSSGKIRFYGVSKLAEGEKNLRAAEQRAWADGLKTAEKNIPVLLSSKLGTSATKFNIEALKLVQYTTSVSTMYFGDHRVKVTLEAPLGKILPQLLGETGLPKQAGEPLSFILRVNGSHIVPAAILTIIDDRGREVAKMPALRWFKGNASPTELGLGASAPVVSSVMTAPGVLKIAASDWRKGYGAAMAEGKGAILVQ